MFLVLSLSLTGCYLSKACRGGGMADATDLKSVVRKDVRVRLPPSAPFISITYSPIQVLMMDQRNGVNSVAHICFAPNC